MKHISAFILALIIGTGAAFAQDDAMPDDTMTSDEMTSQSDVVTTRGPGDIYDSASGEPLPAPVPDQFGVSRIAVVRGLDKITARVRDVEVPVGVPVMFESFEILIPACSKRPPEETPETTAFVQITEHHFDGTQERVFSGWMFASSPALNPVEHPVYDVWLMDCRTVSPDASSGSE